MDGEGIFGVVLVIGFVALFAVIFFFAIRAERRLYQRLQALANERGWRFEKTRRVIGTTRHRAKGFTLASQSAGEDWRLDVSRRFSTGGSSRGGKKGRARQRPGKEVGQRTTTPGRAEFRAAEPVLAGGLAVFAPAGTAGAGGLAQSEAAASMLGVFDNKIGKTVLGHFLGADMGEHIGQLQAFPAPEGSGLTVMASADPSLWFDIAAIGEALNRWQPASGKAERPQLAIGEAGLRLFLNREVTDPETVASFIALGQELQQKAMLPR